MKKVYKRLFLVVLLVMGGCFCYVNVGLATMLGVSAGVANQIINIIDTASTVATIISLISVIVGTGVVTTALVATAKRMIKKYGKKYATMW